MLGVPGSVGLPCTGVVVVGFPVVVFVGLHTPEVTTFVDVAMLVIVSMTTEVTLTVRVLTDVTMDVLLVMDVEVVTLTDVRTLVTTVVRRTMDVMVAGTETVIVLMSPPLSTVLVTVAVVVARG